MNSLPEALRRYLDDETLILREGTVTRTARGRRVDITARLRRIGSMLNYTVTALALCGVLFIAIRVITAFTSGRVAQILERLAH